MPTWDSAQYLRFSDHRTRPCRELCARIALASPRRVIDLGCGPGNSTAVLAKRWPDAQLTGLDSSPQMIDAARAADPARRWELGDLAAWAAGGDDTFDVVFSNAAIQWVDDHAGVLPRLLRRVAPGGALAVQMPDTFDSPGHRVMREAAASPAWRARFPPGGVREWHVHEPAFYYDVLAPHAVAVDLWETEYVHVMPDAHAIVEWYRGTGLRPFLEALPGDGDRAAFTDAYLDRLREAYPPRADGRVLFPFRRLFFVAYRAGE